MPEELLQRMRDIHYPDAPGWFPPAPGWWILAILIVALALWLFLWFRRRNYSRAPYAIAMQLLDKATAKQRTGDITQRAYLDECNQIIKRLLIHIRHNPNAVSASGSSWLEELDRLHDSEQFSRGPGAVLGAERYAREVPDDTTQLHPLLVSLVTQLRDAPVDESA